MSIDIEIRTQNGTNTSFPCNLMDQTTADICRTIVCALILTTSIIGNSMVAIVVYKDRKMRTTVNFLMVNMAVSDFLCSVVFIPRVLTEIHTYDNSWLVGGTTGLVLCKVVYFVEDVTVVVSLLTLLMIAIERYNAISCQFLPDTIPRKRCAVTILSTWTLAFFMNTTSFFTFQISIEEEGPSCQHSWDRLVSNPNKAREIEFLVHTIIALMIPFVIVIAFYAVILIRIKRTPVPGEHTSIGQRRKRKRDRNVLYILLAVVLAFGLCWFPFIVYSYLATYIWMKVDSDMEIPCHMETFGEWALYLAYLNSSVNPVIYFTFCENYRNGFYKLIWPCLSTCNVKQPHEKGTHTYARSRVQVSWYRSGRGVPQNEGDNIHLQVQNQD
ncbi:neuropeptide FF receptor 1-like [Stylophora pistillata]|uniref:neuropeptide FF receptor 1-like n=1 Tax=Stylophora pistillata TaxID=50429 RepID=UPI000C051339|nr:neuropeptide FF receptor 1-like [Stylophora pistillata]